MSTIQQQIALALAMLALLGAAVKYGRDQESAEHQRELLERRIEVIEHIEVSEHPDYSLTIYWKQK